MCERVPFVKIMHLNEYMDKCSYRKEFDKYHKNN
jgi:hypothetical protein